ncbi:MAG: hypothetical protein ACM319_04005 [Deltaproteobacteria bacterium]|nr:hypothetical protein [Candidatus Deferrimicrobiaceae bacterium]
MSETGKRPGSRLLFGWALLGGIAAAVFLGASIPEIVAGLAGIVSRTLRLILKVVGIVVALPIAFYLVEKYFLNRYPRNR